MLYCVDVLYHGVGIIRKLVERSYVSFSYRNGPWSVGLFAISILCFGWKTCTTNIETDEHPNPSPTKPTRTADNNIVGTQGQPTHENNKYENNRKTILSKPIFPRLFTGHDPARRSCQEVLKNLAGRVGSV